MDNRLAIEIGIENEALKRGLLEARQLTGNYTDFVKQNSKLQSQYETEAAEKSIAEIRAARRQALTDLDKNYAEAQAKAQGNAVELRKIDENYMKSKKSIYEEGEKLVAKGIARWKDDVNDIIRQAGTEEAASVHATKLKILADLEDQYKQEVAMARKAGDSIDDIKKTQATQRAHLDIGKSEHKVTGQTYLPGFGDEAQSMARQYSSALGPVGGFLGAIGPAGVMAAGSIGVLTAGMAKGIEIANEYDLNITKISTLLNEKQEAGLTESVAQLRTASMETGAPLSELQTTMYNLIGSVPIFADNLDAAASASANAAKTAKALGASTDTVALAMGNLGNASNLNLANMEDQKFVMDAMAQVMNAGVIPSAEVMAQNIAKSAPALAQLTANGREAIKINGALTAAFTQNGLSVDTAQDRIKAFGVVLANADDRMKLIKAGLKGVTEMGQITDINALAESLGQDITKFTSLIGSQEANEALRLIGKQGGEAFKSVMEGFENMGGAADTMYNKMANTTQTQMERIKAITNDIFLTMGQNGTAAMGGLATTTANVLQFIDNALQSADAKYKKAAAEIQNQTQLANQTEISLGKVDQAMAKLNQIGPNLKPLDDKKIIGGLQINLEQIAKTAGPAAAAEIERLMKADGPIGERLEKIKVQLEAIDSQARTGQQAAAMDAQVQAGKALNDVVQQQGNWWQRNLGTILQVGEYVAGGLTGGLATVALETSGLNKNLQDMANADVFGNLGNKVVNLSMEYDSLMQKSKGMVQGSKEYNETIQKAAGLAQELNTAKQQQAIVEKGTQEYADRSLAAQSVQMAKTGETLNAEKAFIDALALAPPELAKSADFQAKLKADIESAIPAMNEKITIQKALTDAAKLEGDERTKALAELVSTRSDDKNAQLLINEATAQGLNIEKDLKAAIEAQQDARMAGLASLEKAGVTLSENEKLELASYQAAKEKAAIQANEKEFQANKNKLLVEQKALEDAVNLATQDILANETLSNEEKAKSLTALAEINQQRIAEIQKHTVLTAQEMAEIENLRVANNVIQDKIKSVEGESKAQTVLHGILSQQTLELDRQIKKQRQLTESIESALDISSKELELKLARGEINQTQYEQQSLDILKKRLDAEVALLQVMSKQKGHQKENTEQQKKVLDLQIAIAKASQPKKIETKAESKSSVTEIKQTQIDYAKIRADELATQKALNEAREKAQKMQIDNMIEFAKTLQNLSNQLRDAGFNSVNQLVSKYRTAAQIFQDALDNIQKQTSKGAEAIAKIQDANLRKAVEAQLEFNKVYKDASNNLKETLFYNKDRGLDTISGQQGPKRMEVNAIDPNTKKAFGIKTQEDAAKAVQNINAMEEKAFKIAKDYQIKKIELDAKAQAALDNYNKTLGVNITMQEFVAKGLAQYSAEIEKAKQKPLFTPEEINNITGALAFQATGMAKLTDDYDKFIDRIDKAFSIQGVAAYNKEIGVIIDDIQRYEKELSASGFNIDKIIANYEVTRQELLEMMRKAPEQFTSENKAQLEMVNILKTKAQIQKKVLEDAYKMASLEYNIKEIQGQNNKLAALYSSITAESAKNIEDAVNPYKAIEEILAQQVHLQEEIIKNNNKQLAVLNEEQKIKQESADLIDAEITAIDAKIRSNNEYLETQKKSNVYDLEALSLKLKQLEAQRRGAIAANEANESQLLGLEKTGKEIQSQINALEGAAKSNLMNKGVSKPVFKETFGVLYEFTPAEQAAVEETKRKIDELTKQYQNASGQAAIDLGIKKMIAEGELEALNKIALARADNNKQHEKELEAFKRQQDAYNAAVQTEMDRMGLLGLQEKLADLEAQAAALRKEGASPEALAAMAKQIADLQKQLEDAKNQPVNVKAEETKAQNMALEAERKQKKEQSEQFQKDIAKNATNADDINKKNKEANDRIIADKKKAADQEISKMQSVLKGTDKLGGTELLISLPQKLLAIGKAFDFTNFAKLSLQGAMSAKEAKKAAQETLALAMESIGGIISASTDAVFQVKDSITEMKNMFKGGHDIGGGVSKGAELTKKIGEALMGSKIPEIKLAGGILMGIGLIAGAYGKIITAVRGKERTESEIAKDKADAQASIIENLRIQKEYLDKQIALGAIDLDQAWEKRAALEDQLRIMREQLGISSEMTELQAADAKRIADENKKKWEDLLAEAEKKKDASRKDRVKFLTETTGFRSDIGMYEDTSDILDNFIEHAKGQVDQFAADSDKWGEYAGRMGESTQALGAILGETKDVASGIVDILKMTNISGPALAQALDMTLDVQRKILADSLDGIKDLSGMTDDEIKTWAQNLSGYSTEYLEKYLNIGPAQIAAIKEFLTVEKDVTEEKNKQLEITSQGSEAEQAAIEAARKAFAHRKAEVDYLNATMQISDEERKYRLNIILEEELAYERKIYDEMLLQNATESAKYDQKELIWNLEKEIYSVMHDQSDLQSEQLKKVKALNQERNQMLMAAKLGGAVDQAKLSGIEDQIIAGLREAGATEEQIQMQLATFRNTMPRFAEGGRTKEGLAHVDDHEAVLNPKATGFLDKMLPGFIESLNKGPDLSLLETIASNYYRSKNELTERHMQISNNTTASINLGGIVINAGNQNADAIAQTTRKEIERLFTGRGIQLGGL